MGSRQFEKPGCLIIDYLTDRFAVCLRRLIYEKADVASFVGL
jgi:hypothetical protein